MGSFRRDKDDEDEGKIFCDLFNILKFQIKFLNYIRHYITIIIFICNHVYVHI